jgi:hypothetical protein
VLKGFAALAIAENQPVRAAQLWAAAEAARERIGAPLTPFDRAKHGPTEDQARRALSPADWNAAQSVGRALSLDQATTLATSEYDQPRKRQRRT